MVSPSIHEQCWEATTSLKDIRKCIRNGHHIMIIMRGIPGSGKSSLASDLVAGTNGAVFNTDKYFMQNGIYQFDPAKLEEYHQKNWKDAKDAIQNGVKPVIIDNTNIFIAHMKPYVTLAVKNLYEIYFVEPETEWKKNAKECARRNAHSVPEEKISYMVECFEEVELSDLIKPTQLRIIPPLTDKSESDDDTMNSLLSTLDSSKPACSFWPSSLLGHAAAVAKTLEKEEIKKTTLSPSVDYQSALCEVVDLLKISSPSPLLKNSSSETKNSEQLFSLIPSQTYVKNVRTVGCQTSDLIRIFELLDSSSSTNYEFFGETMLHDFEHSDKKKMRGKAIQAGDGIVPSDIDILLALFPNEKAFDLSHILEIAGLNNAVILLREMNAHMDISAQLGDAYSKIYSLLYLSSSIINKYSNRRYCCENVEIFRNLRLYNKNIEAEPLSRTFYWWDDTESEGISENSSSPTLEISNAVAQKLAPCTYMQFPAPEPVPQGYYRMEISVDMMEHLTQLFGDGENTAIIKTYVDLPMWLWRRIYLYWQGIPTAENEVDNGFGKKNFGFSVPTNSDEELARMLQDQELTSNISLGNGKHMSIAERLQLNALIKDYTGIDRQRIAECFRDNQFSAEATRSTLELFINGIEDVHATSTDPSQSVSSINQSNNCSMPATSSRYCVFDGLSTSKPNLEVAHKDVCELREEADRWNKQKHEMMLRANNQREPAAKMFYIGEAQKCGKKARDCVAELNERLIEANSSSLFIDLHYMDVQFAIKLLKAKLHAADRPPELRHGRSGKKLVVLTGYGKLNCGQAKIKPAVIQWLEQCGYEYCNSTNKGVIIVECK
uniref:Smr domain-containing protein n=1 Tax=Setaria digitata TaxID=48799 RepID=A0A915PQD5_9BILA